MYSARQSPNELLSVSLPVALSARLTAIEKRATLAVSKLRISASLPIKPVTANVLKKGELITVEGYFKPEEWTDSKSGEKRNRIVMVATKFYR